MLERPFSLSERGATLGMELMGGLTTFMVMSYIIYSITNGIGAGFVTHCFVKLVRGKGAAVHPMMYGVALAFLIYFALPWLRSDFRL